MNSAVHSAGPLREALDKVIERGKDLVDAATGIPLLGSDARSLLNRIMRLVDNDRISGQ